MNHRISYILLSFIVLFALGGQAVQAEIPKAQPVIDLDKPSHIPPSPLTLKQAISVALQNTPSLHVSQAQIAGAKGEIGLAKTAYLPKLDLLFQENRATKNNITGMILPQAVIPTITGPVLNGTSTGTAWGSALGSLLSWEPFDFGYRKASVNVAKAQLDQAIALNRLTVFNVTYSVSQAYFNALASYETIIAEEANIQRIQVFIKVIEPLVKNGLNPGADLFRAKGLLATSQVRLSQAKGKEKVSLAQLAKVMGVAGQSIAIQDDGLLELPKTASLPEADLVNHPELQLQKQIIERVKAREERLSVQYRPKLNVQAALYGRGSGIDQSGNIKGGAQGLVPTRVNAATGLTITFPVMDYAAIREEKRIEHANEQAERGRYEEMAQEIIGNMEEAKATLEAAIESAKQTPIAFNAAKATEAQIMARYKAGLTNAVDMADAERTLTQAQIDDVIAHIAVWQALLSQAVTQGDLQPFLNLVKTNTAGGTP